MARHHNTTNDMAGRRDTKSETGLLTRCVPSGLKHSAIYRWWLRFTRVLQFLSSIISLGIFSSRIYKVARLVRSFRAVDRLSAGFGAVEGILAAAVLYTLISTMVMCFMRGGRGPTWLRWLWVLMDILFVIAFIVVAVLTSPNGGVVGPRHCYSGVEQVQGVNGVGQNRNVSDDTCNLPWGVFILAIISTILHAITAAFNEVRDYHNKNKLGHEKNGHGHHGPGPVDRDGFQQFSGQGQNGHGHGHGTHGQGTHTQGTHGQGMYEQPHNNGIAHHGPIQNQNNQNQAVGY